MCRQFALALDWEEIAELLSIQHADFSTLPSLTYSITPHEEIGVIAQDSRGIRHLSAGIWSLLPNWATTRQLPFPTYNARIESSDTKPTFAQAMRSQRALIPCSGYFEWKTDQAYYFHFSDNKPLMMAGLYSWWQSSHNQQPLLTATVITCQAVDQLYSIHNRMPLIIGDKLYDDWLNPEIDGSRLKKEALRLGQESSRTLDFYAVASSDSNGSECIAPLSHDSSTQIRGLVTQRSETFEALPLFD